MKKNLLIIMLIVLMSCVFTSNAFASGSESMTLSCYTTTNLTKYIIVSSTNDILVNWGDGKQETVPKNTETKDNTTLLEHTYATTGSYTITITAEGINWVYANSNDIYEIDLSNISGLEYLNLNDNKLEEINLSNNLLLKTIDVSDNYLKELTVVSNNIEQVTAYNNHITSIQNINSNVKILDIKYNKIQTIDLTNFTKLEILDCCNNDITNLNVQTCTLLKALDFSNNYVSEINLNNNILLEELYCFGNSLTNIDISNNPKLKTIECRRNKITSLNLVNNTNLKELYCFDNKITDLDLLNISLEKVVVDNTVNILNNISNVLVKVKYTGDGVVLIGYDKTIELYSNNENANSPKVLINGVQENFPENKIDINNYSGEVSLEVIFEEIKPENFEVVNNPKLVEGMIPVKHNGTNWVVTSENDIEWYNYDKNNMKWANVMLRDDAYYLGLDGKTLNPIGKMPLNELIGKEIPEKYTGSMYVWIPRYTYKIIDNTINIKYSSNLYDYTEDEYKVHPAFNYSNYKGGEASLYESYEDQNMNRVAGIWIAKYPAGRDNSAKLKFTSNSAEIKDLSIGEAFTKAKDISKTSFYGLVNSTSHMMKNTEWGAISYLTTSVGNLSNNSTTGNIYGIYGMDNGAEYVSSFVELVGGISNFSVRKNGKSLLPYKIISYEDYEPANMADIEIFKLKSATDDNDNNYSIVSEFKGIGISEISATLTGNVTKNIPNKENAFMIRGIDGIYSYSGTNGLNNNNIGFRSVILGNADDNIPQDKDLFRIISSSGEGGKISPLGNTILEKGSSIVYSIIPDEGHEIIDVIVDDISVYKDLTVYTNYSTYKFDNIQSNHTIKAIFDGKVGEYEIVVNKNPVEAGEVTGAGMHNSRTSVTLIADKKNGYKFNNWEVIEGLSGNVVNLESNTITFIMPSNNVILQANFVKLLEALLRVENLYGSISMNKIIDSTVNVTAGENDQYGFVNWEGTGITLTPEQINSPKIEFKMPEEDVNLVAKYKKLYMVRMTTVDGTVVETYHPETKEVVVTSPLTSQGKNFVKWTFSGIDNPTMTGNEIRFVMPANIVDLNPVYE